VFWKNLKIFFGKVEKTLFWTNLEIFFEKKPGMASVNIWRICDGIAHTDIASFAGKC
jgi:hypothetical protein